MSKPKQLRASALLLLLLLLLGSGYALAQAPLAIRSWTVDGGGGTLQGSNFTLHGTFGQPDNGVLAGGEYRLYGGFWGPATTSSPSQPVIYLPSISNE